MTEQLDALRTLATHPVDYLVVPRLLATMLAMPLLAAEAIAVGILGGYAVCYGFLGIFATYAWDNMVKYTHPQDVAIGLAKAFIFGTIIGLISLLQRHDLPGRRRGSGPCHHGGGRLFFDHHSHQQLFPHPRVEPINWGEMIEVRQLRKSFGRQEVLAGVNLKIERGESVVVIGRSGGGKSVLLKHLVGLISPDAGEVWIEGQNIVRMNERQLLPIRHKFGMLFQNAALFDSLNVAENVAFALRRGARDHRGRNQPAGGGGAGSGRSARHRGEKAL